MLDAPASSLSGFHSNNSIVTNQIKPSDGFRLRSRTVDSASSLPEQYYESPAPRMPKIRGRKVKVRELFNEVLCRNVCLFHSPRSFIGRTVMTSFACYLRKDKVATFSSLGHYKWLIIAREILGRRTYTAFNRIRSS